MTTRSKVALVGYLLLSGLIWNWIFSSSFLTAFGLRVHLYLFLSLPFRKKKSAIILLRESIMTYENTEMLEYLSKLLKIRNADFLSGYYRSENTFKSRMDIQYIIYYKKENGSWWNSWQTCSENGKRAAISMFDILCWEG